MKQSEKNTKRRPVKMPDIRLYTTNTDSDDVSVVDPSVKSEIARVPVGGSPRGPVKFDKLNLFGYVCNTAGNTISVIDLYRNREISRIDVGLAPRGLDLTEDGKYAFVSNSGSNTLSIIDLLRRKQIDEIGLGINPRHMEVLQGKSCVNVCSWGSDFVTTLDYSKGIENIYIKKVMGVGFDARPYSVAINKTGKTTYVVNTMADYMSVLDNEKGKETDKIKIGYGARQPVLSESGDYAFVSTEVTNDVTVVDLKTNKVVHRVPVGPTPRGLVLEPVSNMLYVASFPRSEAKVGERNSINIVDASNPTKANLIGSIIVGQGPCAISMLTL